MGSRVSAAVATALVLVAVPALPAPVPPAPEETLKLIAQRAHTSLGTSIPVSLTSFIVGGPLLDAVDKRKVGEGKTVCTFTDVRPFVVPPEASADCRSVYTLVKGQVHLSSSRVYHVDFSGVHYRETKLAITGGTDDYRTARGDATGTFQKSASGISYTVDIRLTTG